MKPIYKSLALSAMALSVSLSLQAQVKNGDGVTNTAVEATSLDGLKVELVSSNVTGARDLIASGECEIDGANLNISLNTGEWLKGATYSVRVSAVFGTQTVVLYVLNVEVPYYGVLASEPQEYEDTIVVVSTYGDGDKSGADANVYAKDGDGNAHITTPLSIGDGVASGDGAVASGHADGNGASIQATSEGAVASGSAHGEGASIQATSEGAVASGIAYGEGANIEAGGEGAVASGRAYGEGAIIEAGGEGAVASGRADAGASIQAEGDGAVASGRAYGEGASIRAGGEGAVVSGYADETGGNVEANGKGSQAFGVGTQTQTDGQMVLGKCNVLDTEGDYALIVGNGADNQNRSNAFAIDWNGNLVLFNAGTPVVLTPAKLAALIA